MKGSVDSPNDDGAIGYKRPPTSGRFQKGHSGNLNGRPKNHRKQPPRESILGRVLTVRDGGIEKSVTVAEALILKVVHAGLKGNTAAARDILRLCDTIQVGIENAPPAQPIFTVSPIKAGSVGWALEPLRIAKKLDRFRDTSRYLLEPWIVEMALDRLGEERLSPEEQRTVVEATKTPKKVNWPDWWVMMP